MLVSLVATVFMFWRSDRNPIVIPTPIPKASSVPMTELPAKPREPIQLTSPENEAVFDNKAITIAGEASPEALVVIFVNQKSFAIDADRTGKFTLDVNLESGSNQIMAAVVDENGETFWDKRLVVYTNKSLEEILLTDDELEKEIEKDQQQGEPQEQQNESKQEEKVKQK